MVTRRTFLTASGLLATGAVAGAASFAINAGNTKSIGDSAVSPHGEHQAGIELDLQTFGRFIAFDLKPQTDKVAMLRWMGLISDDISRLTAGEGALADPAPQIAVKPARLTITVGFGLSLFAKLNLEDKVPTGFIDLPSFKIDQLDLSQSGGDLLIHVASDDPLTLSHAARTVTRDSLAFADVKWVHDGFTNAQGVERPGKTQRNLMGQVDGTDNPALGSSDFDSLVWIKDGPEWAIGGTGLVLRKIRMNLNTWESLSTSSREEVIGRRLSDGAPLGGNSERDAPNLEATDSRGLKVIPPFAHIRRAAGDSIDQRFFRRPFNYEQIEGGSVDSGLLWTAYCANIERQYLPVQQKLAEFDLLNKWTTPIASSTFLIPPGFTQGKILAEKLFA